MLKRAPQVHEIPAQPVPGSTGSGNPEDVALLHDALSFLLDPAVNALLCLQFFCCNHTERSNKS